MSQQVCVLSTHYEGMPLSLIEGMAAGCAVVGSRVPGVREVLQHERNGLLVDEGDPEALADALERLLARPQEAAAMAAQGQRDARERHGLALMLSRYEALFLRLLGQRAWRA
jgi:glycosyltransferase involved in cell wall biosynthesis